MANYYAIIPSHSDELTHFGVKGMKWGVRRYRNRDGTLAIEGRKRYLKMNDVHKYSMGKALKKDIAKTRRARGDGSAPYKTIGPNSKAAKDNWNKAVIAYQKSENGKNHSKALRKLDLAFENDEITDEKLYQKEVKKINAKYKYPYELENYTIFTSTGIKYNQAFLNTYGRDINIGYLKDLGFNDKEANSLCDDMYKYSDIKQLF